MGKGGEVPVYLRTFSLVVRTCGAMKMCNCSPLSPEKRWARRGEMGGERVGVSV